MSTIYSAFPTPPWATTLILLGIAIVLLYMARSSAHGAINSLFRALYNGLRMGSRSVALAEQRLSVRNRDVLLALGRDHAERELNREFFRINKFVERDLGGYPQVQRTIQEQITQINEDYKASAEVPPPSPEWVHAVESVAKLHVEKGNNSLTAQILEDIYKASEDQHRDTLQEYRQAMAERHTRLRQMAPYWRKLSNSIDQVGKHLQELVTRAQNVDRQMEQFQEIDRGTDKAARRLKASNSIQFCVALLFVLFGVGGAFFNFHLIALPMSEMVGAAARVGGVKVSDVAALVIIFLEITMGMFLLECLQWTRLFPIIGAMDDKVRIRIAIACGTILLVLAGVEAGLAFMRDQIAADHAALRASLAGTAIPAGEAVNTWIPQVTGMFLGFTVPLALTLIAIPLEYLINTGRNVFGMLLEYLLRLLSIGLRLLSAVSRNAGRLAIHLYDILIVLPLWLEGIWLASRRAARAANDGAELSRLDSVDSTTNFYSGTKVSKNA
ncbi:hypothetical protein FKG94_09265 [Exilibacterium tricleocarpae]|uniref:Uncharacterized protein n=1 Tax=Exilibacterium tricleocarpae TaxID=2591008 RepID=A0A545TVN0_9GAMM|nr:hypothetical protein [Exilibacterium tricleocarpae]TQV81275.1 hypothetical protein FKG94_09265 [Exilibacterium tricleocarpae]